VDCGLPLDSWAGANSDDLEYLVRLTQVVEKHLGLLQGFHVFAQIAEHHSRAPDLDVTQLVFDCLQGITRMRSLSSSKQQWERNQPMVRDRSTSSKMSSRPCPS